MTMSPDIVTRRCAILVDRLEMHLPIIVFYMYTYMCAYLYVAY